jgi:hypothetical protein
MYLSVFATGCCGQRRVVGDDHGFDAVRLQRALEQPTEVGRDEHADRALGGELGEPYDMCIGPGSIFSKYPASRERRIAGSGAVRSRSDE